MEQTLATIMGWGATFSPRGWAFCHGQLLAISSNDALFSLIGTIYGGDGRTTFALPDLRGRGPVGFGQSPGTSFWPIGARVGSEDEVLTQLSLPVHNHSAQLENATMPLAASSNDGTTGTPSGNEVFAAPRVNAGALNTLALAYADAGDADTTLQGGAVIGTTVFSNAGGSQSFSVVQPVQAIHWIIAIYGTYPSRN